MVPNESFIKSLNLPSHLKEYFLKSERIKKFITRENLEDIEDIYLLFNSVYLFNESIFSSHVILLLSKSKEFDYYFHLKQVLETDMEKIPRTHKFEQINKTLAMDYAFLKDFFKDFTFMMMSYTEEKEVYDFVDYYKYLGKLEMINIFIDDDDFKALLKNGYENLNLLKDKKSKGKVGNDISFEN